MRIPQAGRYKTISGYFDEAGALADAVVALADENFPGIYFTINPVNPDLLARSANKYTKYAKETTADAGILRRRWLPIDLDPIRPSGISSNEEEHQAALQKARDIREWLISRGWPASAFILADSGNGGHLVVKVDLPNTEAARDQVKGCLEALDSTFSDDKTKVDISPFNAARIWKLYGTMARKGSSTTDRPHRLASIIEAPDGEMETVSRKQLEALAAVRTRHKESAKSSQKGADFDPVRYAEVHGATVAKVKTGWVDPKGKKWTLAILEECPFNSDHNRGEAWVGVADSGERGFGCPHDGCKSNDWQALKRLWGSPIGNGNKTKPEPEERPESEGEITEEELDNYSLPEGPAFECCLPREHFIQRFMAFGSDISDAYNEYWFAGGLFALAVIADKKIKVALKQGTIYPNLYVSINGKSSLARKSTVVDKVEELLFQVSPGLLSARVPAEFSPEAFTEHLSDYNHAPWIRDEAAGVLALMKRDYMRGFKDSLMQLYDCKPFCRKLRTSQRKNVKTEFRVDDPYLNVLWATTDASLGANTEQNDTLSGFMARFLYFFPQGKKSKWLPLEEGTAANSVFEGVVRDQLAGIAAQIAALLECTATHLSPEAAGYYTEWQRVREEEWTASNDGNAMQIYSRLAPTIIKMAMLFEMGSPDFDVSRPIRLEFVEEACRLVDSYFMPTARAVYDLVGANADKNRLDKIAAYLKRQGGKAQKRDILRATRLTKKEFDEAIEAMLESGEIEQRIDDPQGKRGRPKIWILLKENSVVNVIKVNKVINVNKVNRDNSHESNEWDKRDISDINDINDKNDKNHPDDQPVAEQAGIGPHPRAEEQPKPLKAIYVSGGAAREYAEYSLNLHNGCSHGCLYCYEKGKFTGTCNTRVKKASLENIEADLKSWQGERKRVHLTFRGDPYDLGREDNSDVRAVLELFRKYHHPFQILTKGGTKAVDDFDLYFEGCRFGCTLTFADEKDSRHWEPGAAPYIERLAALQVAHEMGIETWASLEPVIDPCQTLTLIDVSYKFVDFYGVGKWNHDEMANIIVWPKFREAVEDKLKGYGKAYMIKEALRKAAPIGDVGNDGGKSCHQPKTDEEAPPVGKGPGFEAFKVGMAKRKCCLCGRSFPYDLTWHSNGDKSGYECTSCMMYGAPPKPDPQTTLSNS
jgi:DNA repair photolyase